MGGGTSLPIPNLPSNNYMAIALNGFDTITILYGGKLIKYNHENWDLICDMWMQNATKIACEHHLRSTWFISGTVKCHLKHLQIIRNTVKCH